MKKIVTRYNTLISLQDIYYIIRILIRYYITIFEQSLYNTIRDNFNKIIAD